MSEKNSKEKLIDAYEHMMERVQQSLETVEAKARPKLQQAIDLARQKAVELDEITREEAHKVGEYLQRDIQELSAYLRESGKELSDWFDIDRQLIEARIRDLISSVADKTQVELAELAERAKNAGRYHTGEVAAPGTLECENCGERIHFQRTGHIPPCPVCHQTHFRRPRPQA